MALHTLKIVVVDGGRASGYSASRGSGSGGAIGGKSKVDKNSPLYKLLHIKDTIKEKTVGRLSPAKAYAVSTFGNLAMQTVKAAHNYRVSDIGRSSGDSNYQAMVNRQYEIVGQAVGVLNSAISGATAGAMFGGVGAVVGMVAGLASSAISLGFQHAERQRTYQHEMFKNNTSQAYNLARANYSISTGRLR